MTFRRHKGGHGWRILEDGSIEVEGEGVPRTRGEPASMELLLDCHGIVIDATSCRFRIPKATIMAMIAKEAVRRDGLYFEERSKRWEERLGEHSAGLMQTLVSTANAMERKFGLYGREIGIPDLFCPEVSIMLGVAYIRYQADRRGDVDPVLAQAAFNAGGVYETSKNRWNLRTHSPTRTDSFIAWHNDAIAVLEEGLHVG